MSATGNKTIYNNIGAGGEISIYRALALHPDGASVAVSETCCHGGRLPQSCPERKLEVPCQEQLPVRDLITSAKALI